MGTIANKNEHQISILCRNCTKMEDCLKNRLTALFMAHTTYCTRFNNKDKEPRIFPFLQPYEVEYMDAEYIYNKTTLQRQQFMRITSLSDHE